MGWSSVSLPKRNLMTASYSTKLVRQQRQRPPHIIRGRGLWCAKGSSCFVKGHGSRRVRDVPTDDTLSSGWEKSGASSQGPPLPTTCWQLQGKTFFLSCWQISSTITMLSSPIAVETATMAITRTVAVTALNTSSACHTTALVTGLGSVENGNFNVGQEPFSVWNTWLVFTATEWPPVC